MPPRSAPSSRSPRSTRTEQRVTLAISGTTPAHAADWKQKPSHPPAWWYSLTPTPYEPGPLLQTIAAEFACTVRGERPQPLDVHQGVHLQRLIAAVAESIDSKTVVTL